jgi:hypothetical protein
MERADGCRGLVYQAELPAHFPQNHQTQTFNPSQLPAQSLSLVSVLVVPKSEYNNSYRLRQLMRQRCVSPVTGEFL